MPSHPAPARRNTRRAALAAALVAIAAITLQPSPGSAADARATPILCLVCGSFGAVDVLLNIVLFLPFGAALAALDVPLGRAVVRGLLVSFTIELLQFTVIPGRDASLSDVVTNTLGTALGAAGWVRLPALLFPAPPAARRLRTAAAAVVLAHAALVTWLMQPDATPAPWFGQVAPDLAHLGRFAGTVRRAGLAATDRFETGELPPTVQARARATPVLHADVDSAPATSRLSPIVAIADGVGAEQRLLGQRGTALVVRVRLRAAAARLGWPALRLDSAFSCDAPCPARASGGWRAGRLVASAAAGGRQRAAAAPLGPGWGWRLLLPIPHFAPSAGEAALAGALWLALLGLPFGWWSARAGPPWRALVAWTALQPVALALIPAAGGLPPAPWPVWLGAWLGAPVAAWLAQRVGARPAG